MKTHRRWLDSITAQAIAALILAVMGSVILATILWHFGEDDRRQWHHSVHKEMAVYQKDRNVDALIVRLAENGIDTTTDIVSYNADNKDQNHINQHSWQRIWVRLPTDTPLWAALDPKEHSRRINLGVWAFGMVLILTFLGSWLTLYWIKPLRRLSASASDIVQGQPPPDMKTPFELTQLLEALTSAASKAKATVEGRKLFLAGVSHDLRQPLARIQMSLALMNVEDQTLMEGIERDLKEMDSLLSQFVEWVRDGQDEVRVPVNLSQLCQEVSMSDMNDWHVVLSDDNSTIMAPPLALRRALANLLHNAGKHGKAPFNLIVNKKEQGWNIIVQDHGVSIPPVNPKHLLEPFTGAGSRAGAGLGLAVVHRVIHHMGGELTFSPTTDSGGWTVSVYLPNKLKV